MVILPKSSSRMTTAMLSVCILFLLMYSVPFLSTSFHPVSLQTPLQAPSQKPSPPKVFHQPGEEQPTAWENEAKSIAEKARYFIDTPIRAPYKEKFYDVGQRTQIAREWVKFLDSAGESDDKQTVQDAVESAIACLFPFIQNSPKRPDSTTPFTDVRSSIEAGSRGIVIPTGKGTMRYAAHLIGSLREVLQTKLAIQIVYAGDEDLPAADRERLQARFPDIEFLDILSVLDDTTLQLATGGWAIKAFAALYSPFEEVILTDADSVFLQVPEKLYSIPSYISTGVLLFHDRLLWQHAFPERHEWWRSQIHKPSATLNKSLVWAEDYAEEGDSGVVVIDKSQHARRAGGGYVRDDVRR
ncbi:putative alpha-1,3-mannosyltransferase MNN14 [Colletotrichum fructicola Nara gc5]|uniref:Putative alpha-1,3-mannosyltransferase MNN14 n=1 Tax=Colletotrichum fructicola (strain Nara gc5) TaxID=1213859 RepID=A0A7J6IE27_COLFN|nr:putative alpha-1,3-mannosyltransferase MNN14 [Colletotrichum fructicola Nara gc5]